MQLFVSPHTQRMPEALYITITALLIAPFYLQPFRTLIVNKLGAAKLLTGASSFLPFQSGSAELNKVYIWLISVIFWFSEVQDVGVTENTTIIIIAAN